MTFQPKKKKLKITLLTCSICEDILALFSAKQLLLFVSSSTVIRRVLIILVFFSNSAVLLKFLM